MLFFTAIILMVLLIGLCQKQSQPQQEEVQYGKPVLEILSEKGYTIELDFREHISDEFYRKSNNLFTKSQRRYFSAGIVSAPIDKIFLDYDNETFRDEIFNTQTYIDPYFILLEGIPVKMVNKRDIHWDVYFSGVMYNELYFLQMETDEGIIYIFTGRQRGNSKEMSREDFLLLQDDPVYQEYNRRYLHGTNRYFDELEFNDDILKHASENNEKVFFLASVVTPTALATGDLRVNEIYYGELGIFGLSSKYQFMQVYSFSKIFTNKQELLNFYADNAEEYLLDYYEFSDRKVVGYWFN
jgi:hypothetical protein